jgi:hypothetical protein
LRAGRCAVCVNHLAHRPVLVGEMRRDDEYGDLFVTMLDSSQRLVARISAARASIDSKLEM